MNSMKSMRHNRSIRSILNRILLAASVYFIWNERNKRLFTDEKKGSKELAMNIINHMRLKLSSLTVRKTNKVMEVCKEWEVIMNQR